MKRILILGAFIAVLFGFATIAIAAPYVYQVGGTATSTPDIGELAWWGTTHLTGVATTSVSCSGNTTCTSFTAIGSSPITISSSGGGSGNVATSSAETADYIPYWTTTSATPAKLSGGTSSFEWNPASHNLKATYASTTQVSASTGYCIGSSCITSWPSGGTPGGSNTDVQYNNSGSLGGDSGLTYDSTGGLLSIQGTLKAEDVEGFSNLVLEAAGGSPYLNLGVGIGINNFNDDAALDISTSTSNELALLVRGNASTTELSAKTLCLSTVCKTSWPTTAASSTLLSDNNTFSGLDKFTGATTTLAKAVIIGTSLSQSNLLSVNCGSTSYPGSISSGGCVNLSSSGPGPNLIIYTSGAGTNGRAVSIDCNNSSFGDNCFNLQSTETGSSVFNLQGAPNGLGAFKWSANGAGTSNSAGISLDASTNSFAGAALFMKCSSSATGNCWQTLNSSSATIFDAMNNGNFGIATGTPGSLLAVGSNINLTNGTSTFSNGGINLKKGCFSIAGNCLSSSASNWTLSGDNIYNNNDSGLGSVAVGTSSFPASFTVQDNTYSSMATSSTYSTPGSFPIAGCFSGTIYLWGAGGGGGGGSGRPGGPGAYVTETVSNVCGAIIYVGSGGQGGSTAAGLGGSGFASGGAGSLKSTYGGGGGGGSSSYDGYIAAGGGGGNVDTSSSNNCSASGTIGGVGQSGSTYGAGGGGGAGTVGGNASGSTGGTAGTGATSMTGTPGSCNHNNQAGGPSAAGASGNGNSSGGGGSGSSGYGANGSGGAAGGTNNGNGTNGSGEDSGGGGGSNSTGNGGNGGTPAAGGAGSGVSTGTGGTGGNGEVILSGTIKAASKGPLNIYISSSSAPVLSLDTLGQFILQQGSTVIQEITNIGHLITGGSVPNCSTGCSAISGDDRTFRIVTGSSVTSAVVDFANAWAESPNCIPTEEASSPVAIGASTTKSTVTLYFSSLTSKEIAVNCQQSNNFTY